LIDYRNSRELYSAGRRQIFIMTNYADATATRAEHAQYKRDKQAKRGISLRFVPPRAEDYFTHPLDSSENVYRYDTTERKNIK